MKHFDVILVGAGPAGGHIASLLSEDGFEVGLFEEHNEVGKPVQCAGLVSLRVFDILGDKKGVLNEISGAVVHSPLGKTLKIIGDKSKACVIDRTEFDRNLVNSAVDSGCDLHVGSKVKSAFRKDGQIRIEVKKEGKILEYSGKLIIGCDGVGSVVARSFGFSKPKEVLSGFGAECILSEKIDTDYVDIFVGNKIAPGFFGWLIPTDSGARLGLCTAKDKKNTKEYFSSLLSHPEVKDRLGKISIERYIAGAIPLGSAKKIVANNVMLAGDSACHVKPLSGGGIYLGLLAGTHATACVKEALNLEDYSEKTLKKYPKMMQNDVGKELKRAHSLRKIFMELSDSHIEEGFKILNDEKILSLLGKKGDIDYPSGLTKAVLKKAPRLMKFASPVLKSLI
jgi:geranylgeranyl reductase family protein